MAAAPQVFNSNYLLCCADLFNNAFIDILIYIIIKLLHSYLLCRDFSDLESDFKSDVKDCAPVSEKEAKVMKICISSDEEPNTQDDSYEPKVVTIKAEDIVDE